MKTACRANAVRAVVALASAATLFGLFPSAARADFKSISVGDGAEATARGNNQLDADLLSLDLCNASSPKKNCKILIDRWVVLATSERPLRFGIGSSYRTKDEATKTALSYCGAACKVTSTITTPGYYSFAMDEKRTQAGLRYGYTSKAKSEAAAVERCEYQGPAPCKVLFTRAIEGDSGPDGVDDANGSRRSMVPDGLQTSEQNCRPRTSSIRCSSRCYNGSCEITYENGCKIHVDVNAQFDPLTNQWSFPAPAC